MNHEPNTLQGQTYFEAPEATKGQQFTNYTFQSANLSGKDFSGSTFTDCTFDHAYAKGADFTNASFDHCTLSHSSFKEASFKEASFTDTLGNGNDYRDASFTKASFVKSRENEAHLNGADFTDTRNTWPPCPGGIGSASHASWATIPLLSKLSFAGYGSWPSRWPW